MSNKLSKANKIFTSDFTIHGGILGDEPRRFYSAQDLAEECGVKLSTINKWVTQTRKGLPVFCKCLQSHIVLISNAEVPPPKLRPRKTETPLHPIMISLEEYEMFGLNGPPSPIGYEEHELGYEGPSSTQISQAEYERQLKEWNLL